MSSAKRSPLTIVMAEDDPDDRLLISEAFKDAGLATRIEFVPDGEAALMFLRRSGPYAEMVATVGPALVMLDLNMPRMGGLETLTEIRADPALRHVPVIVLTTSNSPQDILASYRAGCNAYLCKPNTFAGLVDVVRHTLDYWLRHVEIPVTE